MATTTAYAPRGAGGGASETGPRSPDTAERRRRLTTPARLWIALAAAVAALLAVGGTCTATLTSRQASEARAAGSAEPLVQNVNELYHALAEADATAATALLVGPVPPTGLTSLYNSDVNQAVTALSTASRELAGDDSASAQLAMVAGQLPLYTGYIATAQAENRFGYPVAGAYLREASELMHGHILKEVRSVADEESAAQRSAQAEVAGFPVWIVVVGVLAALVLILAGREVSRSTRRRFNAGILAGVLIALGVVVWSLVATSSAEESANAAQGAFGQVATTLWDRDSLALADSYQALTLVDRGEDNGTDAQNQASALGGVDYTVLDSTASELFDKLKQQLIDVRTAIDGGDYYKAIDLIVGHGAQAGPNTINAEAAALDHALVADFNVSQAEYANDAKGADSALSGGLWGGLIGGVLAALAAAYGINRRLAEYR